MEIKEAIRTFVAEKLIYAPWSHTDDTKLVQEGIIDSLGVLEISEFIKEKFGVPTTEGEITPENFATINLMEQYVLRKQQCSPQP